MKPTESQGMQKAGKRLCLTVLFLASGLLLGCATKSTDSMPVQPPKIPSLPPALQKPVSQESYLDRAQRNIEAWRKKLTDSEIK